MKLTHMKVTAQISELGTYEVVVWAEDSLRDHIPPYLRRFRYELPVGQRPVIEDVRSILQMVAEELQR